MVYTNLLSQITIGNMTVRNRVFMAPMSTHLADTNGLITEELLAYYEERAKGGVGYITIPSILIEKYSRYGTYRNLGLYDDWCIDNMKKLVEKIHENGACIGAQLLHAAIACPPEYNEGRQPIAASTIISSSYRNIPRSLTVKEIEQYIEMFAIAAERAQLAGFDAVELHCCHGHGLLGNFISPLYNKRIDEYGGNVDGRLKFPLAVVRRVREYVGEDYPIIIRMSASDEEPGGQSILEGCYIAKQFECAGASMINLSNGTFFSPWKTTAPVGSEVGLNAEIAKKIKSFISIPLGVVGRINEPWIGEYLLTEGNCDVCYVGRALICDPDFVCKAEKGEENEIRRCIGCLQCLTAANTDGEFGCSINPEAGHETQKNKLDYAMKKVLIVGGGPGGLTAAIYASKRGHKVTLMEQEGFLGGQLRLAAVPPCKQELTNAVKYMVRALQKNDVDVYLNKTADIDTIKSGGYDYVILAQGNSAIVPDFIRGANNAITAREALASEKTCGKNIVIIGGGSVGCETADYLLNPHLDLSENWRHVTIIEQADVLCQNEKTSARPLLIERLISKGCRILTGCKIVNVVNDTVEYKDGEVIEKITGVDTVVAAIGSKSDNTLAEELAENGLKYGVITKNGTIKSSVHEAYNIVLENL